MSGASKPLFDLQEVETQLEAEHGLRQALQSRVSGSAEIDDLQARVARLESEQKSKQKSLRALETLASDAAVKVKRLTETLYGGGIHDSREMASVESEIAHAKAKQQELEDEEIELMESLENLTGELVTLGNQLDNAKSVRAHDLPELQAELANLLASVSLLEQKHARSVAAVEPSQMAAYIRLKLRQGHAVSRVDNGVCQWCRVEIPPKDIQHARGDTLVSCPNCGRILYAE